MNDLISYKELEQLKIRTRRDRNRINALIIRSNFNFNRNFTWIVIGRVKILTRITKVIIPLNESKYHC